MMFPRLCDGKRSKMQRAQIFAALQSFVCRSRSLSLFLFVFGFLVRTIFIASPSNTALDCRRSSLSKPIESSPSRNPPWTHDPTIAQRQRYLANKFDLPNSEVDLKGDLVLTHHQENLAWFWHHEICGHQSSTTTTVPGR